MGLSTQDMEMEELFKIRKRFVKNENINLSTRMLLQEVLQLFRFDRIFIGMKAFEDKECIPLVEYLAGDVVNFFSEVVDFEGYAKFSNLTIDEHEQNYVDLVSENNYFVPENYEKLSVILSHIGYVPSDEGVPKESLLFYTTTKGTFSYVIMERYADGDAKLSSLEKLALSDTYTVMNRRAIEEAARDHADNELAMQNAVLANEQMPMYMVDKKEGKILYFNEVLKLVVPKIHVGAKYDEMFDGNSDLGEDYQSKSELKQNTETLVSYTPKTEGGEKVIYLIKKVIPLTLKSGREVFVAYIKNTEDYIRQLEGIDLLTSAYSMKGLFSYYENNIENKLESDYMLCAFDVSKFKHINDTKGFKAGNTLLKKISDVMRNFIRTQELFCRINGDQFAILLQSATEDEATARINSLFKRLETMREEHFADVGIAYVCGVVDVEQGIAINVLIDRANIARKTAKGSHKNKIIFFNKDLEDKMANEVEIESRISVAVENGEFTPYLQPKFKLDTMEICGAEALVRWITPTGMVFPDRFIPLFEKNGFITTLDFIVYKKVMQHIRMCLDRNITVYPISLNVSRNHIRNKNFATQILDLVNEYQIPLELLELEITESVFVEDREVLKFFVDNIKHTKIKVSIDDFGSAYSSLQVLKDINIDVLKIDKGFLDNIGTDTEKKKDELVLKNIIRLAKDLHCKVICEGVETEKQIKILREIGCELGQGYVFARPMPIDEYEEKYLTVQK